MYHKQCLASYEKYARTRACPLCRAQQYQRIEIDDGARAYRTYCAILIQSFYRGHLARKKYKELRRHNPPKFSEAARRRWAAERLEEESEKMIKEMEGERGDMDDLFAELDAGLKQSREACEAVDSRHVAAIYSRLERQEEEEQRLFRSGWERGSDGSDVEVEAGGRLTAVDNGSLLGGHNEGGASGSIAMRDGEGRGGRGGGASCSSSTPIESATRSSLAREANRQIPSPQQRRTVLPLSMSGGKDEDGVDWGIILARGKERQAAGEEACPICIGPIGRRGQSGVAWLSCSHAFHIHCIMAFEAFELANNSTPSCPVCRMSGYKRRCFDES